MENSNNTLQGIDGESNIFLNSMNQSSELPNGLNISDSNSLFANSPFGEGWNKTSFIQGEYIIVKNK